MSGRAIGCRYLPAAHLPAIDCTAWVTMLHALRHDHICVHAVIISAWHSLQSKCTIAFCHCSQSRSQRGLIPARTLVNVCITQTFVLSSLSFCMMSCDSCIASSGACCYGTAYLFLLGKSASWPWCGANRSAKRSQEAVGRAGSTNPLTVGMTCRGRRAATNDLSSRKLL